MALWTVLARMPDRSIGGVLPTWSGNLTLRFNQVGSWEIEVPPETVPSGWLVDGSGAVFLRDGQVVASGMIDEFQYEWDGEEGGYGTYKITGDTDLARLGYRTIYPTPDGNWSDGGLGDHVQAAYYQIAAQNAEEVLRLAVDNQAGSNSLPVRRVDGLMLGTPKGIGTTVSMTERFTPLLEALRSTAYDGGGLGFDVTDNLNGQLVFNVWQPEDKSRTARFGVELGNVRKMLVREVTPTATTALVAGTGEKEQRELIEFAADSTPVERREAFVDQRQAGNNADPDETAEEKYLKRLEQYEKAALEVLAESGYQSACSATITDTPAVQWLRDFNLGDTVSVLTPFGPVTDLMRQVEISVDENGVEDVESTIGTTDPKTDDPLAHLVDLVLRRVSRLERAQ